MYRSGLSFVLVLVFKKSSINGYVESVSLSVIFFYVDDRVYNIRSI